MSTFPQLPLANDHDDLAAPPVRKRRPWRQKFGTAFRGIKLGVRGHSSFCVHFFFGALVLVAGGILGCNMVEWCILLLCITLVMMAELFNSAIETLFRGLDEDTKQRTWPALDIAAGAVLLISIGAAVVGSIVFLHRLWFFFEHISEAQL